MSNIFLISLCLLLIGGQLGRIQIGESIAFYLHDLLILAFLVFHITNLKILFNNFKKIIKKQKKVWFLFSLTLIVAIIGSVKNNQFYLTSLLYTARFVAYYLFMLVLKKDLGQKKVKQVFNLAAIGLLIVGFLQYLFLPDLTQLYYLGFDDHFYRLTSTILDPGFTGLIFVFALLELLNEKNSWSKIFKISFFLLGLALTYSRASYLSFAIASTCLFWPQKNKERLITFLAVTILVLSLPFLPKKSGGEGVKLERTSSIEARFLNAQLFSQRNQGLARFVGLGPFAPSYETNNEGLIDHSRFGDNIFVFLYNSFGIFGSLLLLLLLMKNKKAKSALQTSLLIAFLIHSQFNSNLSQSFVMLFFWGFYL